MDNARTEAGDRSRNPLLALMTFLQPYWKRAVLAFMALILAAAAQLSLPVALRYLIDDGLLASNRETIDRYFLALAGLVVAFGFFSAARSYLVQWIGERVVADLRDSIYRRMQRLDMAFFESTKTGELLSRLTTDSVLVQTVFGSGFGVALRSMVTLVGASVMLAITSLRLMSIVMMLLALVVLPVALIGRRVRANSRASQERMAETAGVASEFLSAVPTVKAFSMERLLVERFADSVRLAFDAAIRRIRAGAILTLTATLMVFGAFIFVLWIGSQAVLSGSMTGGQLGQFLMYAILVAGASTGLTEIWGHVQRAAGAGDRLGELLSLEPDIVAPTAPVALPERREADISFDDVSFGYPSSPETLVIKELSLTVKAGETLAIVGPSGAGKSSLFHLLLRLYDPLLGAIYIQGIDLRSADPEAVRTRIGLVPQDIAIFGGTVRENIRFGAPNARDEEIIAAACASGVDTFVRALPEGYDTVLGERGARLSGGQRQRIAIARALLRDPPILLLDEATSSLDAESERAVREALERLMFGRTTIIIAHRLSTALWADRIVVLDRGRIASVGTHEQLMENSPLYARLAALQLCDGMPQGRKPSSSRATASGAWSLSDVVVE